ncbi:MAG: hypothetical protein KTR31_38195 [Myxococcales bacterium]|nr:hypothetical protein [Myxococcales bacterium]
MLHVVLGLWMLASSPAQAEPDAFAEMRATAQRAAQIIAACRDDRACGHDRESLGEAFLAWAVAQAVLNGEVDALSAANARALVPERAALWRDLLAEAAGPEDAEAWVKAWVDEPEPEPEHDASPPDPAAAPELRPAPEGVRQRLSATELGRVAGSFGDPLRALQSLPAVARPESLEGDLTVRGSEPGATSVRVDGIPVPYLHHFLIGRSIVDPSWLDGVDLYTGGLPVHLGGGPSAVVDARSRPADPEPGLHNSIRVDALDASFATQGRLGRHWVWSASVRNSWAATLFSLASRSYGLLDDVPHLTLGYTDYRVRLSRPTPHGEVSWTVLGAQDSLVLRGVDQPYDFSKVLDAGFHRLAGRWHRQTQRSQWLAWVATGPDHQLSQLDGVSEASDAVERIRLARWQTMAHLRARAELSSHLSVGGGMEASHSQVQVDDFTWAYVDSDRIEGFRGVRLSAAGFADLDWAGPNGSITPGLRVSGHRFGGAERIELEPRLTLVGALGPSWRLLASVGRHSRVAPPERSCCDQWSADDAVMTSWQAEASVERRGASGGTARLSVHGWRATDLLVKELTPVALPDGPFWARSARNEGGAWARRVATYHPEKAQGVGAEVLVRLPEDGPWSGLLGGSVGRSERWGADGQRLADRDLPWSASAALTRQLPQRWLLSSQLTVSAGDPTTPEQPVYEPSSIRGSAAGPRWAGIPGDRNTARFRPYGRLDLRVARSWVGPRSRWTLHLDVFNVLNVPNPVVPAYQVPHHAPDPTPDFGTYAPILPNLGLEVSF